ncbi:MAG: hypothetical protein WC528_03425 [Patescibacteria group bacterium]
MNNEKKSYIKRFWWLGLILIVLIVGFVYGWITGHRASRLDNENKAAAENETGEPPEIQIVRPTSTPVLSLPFAASDAPDALIPMGETIFHADAALGHPGLDFQWNTNKEIRIIASLDAAIVDIRDTVSNATVMVVTKTDDGWGVDYCGLDATNPNLKVGDKVKIGDFIGWPNNEGKGKNGQDYKNIHWQFGYYDVAQKDLSIAAVEPRLCPMIYFDSASKILIEKIWAETNSPEMKANAPEICSGGYEDKFR